MLRSTTVLTTVVVLAALPAAGNGQITFNTGANEKRFAEKYPKESVAPDALLWVYQNVKFGNLAREALSRLFKDHIESKQMGQLCQTLVGSPCGGEVISVAFSPDGKVLAAGCRGGEITLWDLATGKASKHLQAGAAVVALVFSPKSEQLASCSGAKAEIEVWDLATWKSREMQGAAGSANLAFSPDGRLLAGDRWVDKDGKRNLCARVWDVRTGELLHEWAGARGYGFGGFGFTPDSKRLAVLEDEKTVKVWAIDGKADSKKAVPEREKGGLDGPANQGDRQAKQNRILFWQDAAGDTRLAAVNPRDKKVTRLTDPGEAMPTFPLALSPDGRSVAYTQVEVNGDTASFKVYVRALDDPKRAGRSLEAEGYCPCWSPDGRQLVVVDKDGGYRHYLVDVKSKEKKAIVLPQVEPTKDASGPVGHVITDWSRDGQWFLTMCFTGEKESKARLFRVRRDGTEAQRIKGVESGAWGRFSPDGKRVLYTGPDEKGRTRLFVIDAAGGKPMCLSPELNGSIDESGGFCWSPDGKQIAYLWCSSEDRESGREYETFLLVIDADGRNQVTLLSGKSTLVMPIRYPLWQ